ncbi:MAG: uroporphyrinogen decarboxylase [Ardenticatenaceae bacterium]|nr:uroporphyrinogen decarboxylase [Ardenticatenaceae bacterium]MCB8987396.1 uroporphyrinogen decarboxylase [Ardenticatenaceae bacterium]
MTEPTARFLRACCGLPTDRTPIWLMRQAGRYMAEYRALRAQHSMLECIHTPELAAEITLQPIKAFGFDAAIIFSDILPPLAGMGLNLEFVKGEGPVLHNRIETTRDVDMLAVPPAEETMGGTLKAIELAAAELGTTPLIGFAGAPFTLASYAIEGGGTKTYQRVKSFMVREPAAWKRLMNKLVTVQGDYLLKQAKAGAAALQLFDSWAGHALSKQDYVRYVQPYNKALLAALSKAGVPVINFSTGTTPYIEEVAACGGDVIGVDWHLPLDEVWARIGYDQPIQGNLDPIALLAPWRELQTRVDDVLMRANGRSGHIFNLGHGIYKETPVENVQRLVDYVREKPIRDA